MLYGISTGFGSPQVSYDKWWCHFHFRKIESFSQSDLPSPDSHQHSFIWDFSPGKKVCTNVVKGKNFDDGKIQTFSVILPMPVYHIYEQDIDYLACFSVGEWGCDVANTEKAKYSFKKCQFFYCSKGSCGWNIGEGCAFSSNRAETKEQQLPAGPWYRRTKVRRVFLAKHVHQ